MSDDVLAPISCGAAVAITLAAATWPTVTTIVALTGTAALLAATTVLIARAAAATLRPRRPTPHGSPSMGCRAAGRVRTHYGPDRPTLDIEES